MYIFFSYSPPQVKMKTQVLTLCLDPAGVRLPRVKASLLPHLILMDGLSGAVLSHENDLVSGCPFWGAGVL